MFENFEIQKISGSKNIYEKFKKILVRSFKFLANFQTQKFQTFVHET